MVIKLSICINSQNLFDVIKLNKFLNEKIISWEDIQKILKFII